MFYIESNGFSATRFLARALSAVEGMHCFHGTRALPDNLPLGSAKDLSPDAFIEELKKLESQTSKCMGALHAKFDFGFSQLLSANSAPYTLSVRSPIARIRSCHAWAKGKYEKGNLFPLSPEIVTLTFQVGGMESDFGDLLFTYAALNIITYDLNAYKNVARFSRIYQMEKYTEDKDYFIEMVEYLSSGRCSPADSDLAAIYSDRSNDSHTGAANDPDQVIFLDLPESQQLLLVHLFKNNQGFKDLYRSFGYDVDWIYA